MPSYAEHIAKKALDQDTINNLREHAVSDAKETFKEEQLAHWGCDVTVNDPPAPKQQWLKNWLDRWPDEAEWIVYEAAYKNALRRALYKLDGLFEQFCKDIEDDDADAIKLDCECTEACLAAMEEK
jgi:hypothetical protein